MTSIFGGFRIRLAAFVGGLVLVLALAVSFHVERLAADHMTRVSGERLEAVARAIAGTLSDSLVERTREIELLAASPLLTDGDWGAPALQAMLDRVTGTHRPYAWLGLARADGQVEVAADGLLAGVDVSKRPWFALGLQRTYVGDVHEALLLARLLRQEEPDEPLRFIDFAAPVHDVHGRVRGVVATHLHWTWIRAMLQESLPVADVAAGVEVFVRDRAGNLLHPLSRAGTVKWPVGLAGSGYGLRTWPGEGDWLTAAAMLEAPTGEQDLAWTIVLRQPVASALAAVADLRHQLLLAAVPMTLLCMMFAYMLAMGFSRPVEELARMARRIDGGDESVNFPERSSIREIRRLTTSLRGMTGTLIRRRMELEQANQWLEQKVEARTAELQAANRALEALSATDALTGLANRRRFDEAIAHEWARARRNGQPLAVLLIDLDHFKAYNDRFGHQAGDECLRRIGRVLGERVRRAGEVAARYGGEEFVVVASNTGADEAAALAESIRAGIEAEGIEHPAAAGGCVTASIGIAVLPVDGDEPIEQLVERADQALYRAKSAGRNRVEM